MPAPASFFWVPVFVCLDWLVRDDVAHRRCARNLIWTAHAELHVHFEEGCKQAGVYFIAENALHVLSAWILVLLKARFTSSRSRNERSRFVIFVEQFASDFVCHIEPARSLEPVHFPVPSHSACVCVFVSLVTLDIFDFYSCNRTSSCSQYVCQDFHSPDLNVVTFTAQGRLSVGVCSNR